MTTPDCVHKWTTEDGPDDEPVTHCSKCGKGQTESLLLAAAQRVLDGHRYDTPSCANCGDREISHRPNGECMYALCRCPGYEAHVHDAVLLARAVINFVEGR